MIREAVELLLLSMPELENYLFDFSEPHKIDLEKFMLANFKFNVAVEKVCFPDQQKPCEF